jgi:WS/DGAT/MGAT family acyltransferase
MPTVAPQWLTDTVVPLSGLDALFLYAETASMHLHVALTAIVDPTDAPEPLTFARFRALVAERMHLVPPFTRRLSEAPFGLQHPSWVEVDDVDLDHHVRHVTLTAPGGPEDLGRMCGVIASLPLDRDRPLWEMWFVDGLYDGNLAIIAKVHHACVDGVSAAEQMTVFFDLDAAATVPIVSASEQPHVDAGAPPDDLELVSAALRARAESLRRFVPLARRTAEGVTKVRRRRAQRSEAGGTPLTGPRLSFNRRLTPERNCAFAHVPLTGMHAIKDATRSTLNDVVLALCAGALREYLLTRGELPDVPLVATCPVSTRARDEHGQTNNKLSFLQTRLHTQIEEPLERLHAIRRATNAAKAEHLLLGPSIFTDWAETTDPLLLRPLARFYVRSGLSDHHAPIHNVTISNVPGPPVPIYLGGTRLVRAYPMGPVIEGAGLNITVMSYLDSIDIGFMACDEAMPDVWDLADAVAPAYAALEAAVRVPTPAI